ncbi:ABC transporter ATP-binding protein [Candidatus Gracilibacteria bacterium]|nr:ABC transporter ATP-binding protein [Candidatus Gracilibacteria bacterium]
MTNLSKARKFLTPLFQSKKYLILSCGKFVFWAIYSIISVMLIKNTSYAIETKNFDLYHTNVLYFCGFVVIYFIANYYGRRWEWPRLHYVVEEYISNSYVRKMMLIDNNYLESIGTGKLISIMTTGIKLWTELLLLGLRDFIRTGVIFVVTLYILYSLNGIYGIAFLFLIILIHIGVVWMDSHAHRHRRIRTEKRQEYARKLVQIIMSKMEILQNRQSDIRAKELTKIHKEIEDADDNVSHSMFFIFNIPRLSVAIARIGILYFIGYQVFEGTFTLTDFTLALTILIMFESFLIDSVEFYKNFTKNFSDIESFWKTIDDAPMMRGYITGEVFVPCRANIEINNITYTYGDTIVFEDFSLTIPYGKKIAIVGASGGGKTTLMKLIAGYLHPVSGSISVMGNILSKTALKSYYPHIGYLTQDPSVFDATIRENLFSALPSFQREMSERQGELASVNRDRNPQSLRDSSFTKELTEQKLHEALRLAHCDFVFELEKGLDTEIGERGVRLSGGQKQRLAIAKILLKNPEIILLDEPTSALDSFSEEHITHALDELFKGRTVIVIAHRLQTVKKADEIIVLEGGKVSERGSHDELIQNPGIYSKMLELQSGF